MADQQFGYGFNDWGSRRQKIQDDFATNLAASNYATFLSQQRGARQLGDLRRGWVKVFPRFSAGWATRGFAGPNVRSGVYRRALEDLAAEYARGQSDIYGEMDAAKNQQVLYQAQLEAERRRALADIEFQKQLEIQQAAQNLLNFRTFMNGGA